MTQLNGNGSPPGFLQNFLDSVLRRGTDTETEIQGETKSSFSDDDIIAMVAQHEQDVLPLTDRMDTDFDRYRLIPHVNRDPETNDVLEGYAVYTSPAPRAFADKVISWINLSELMLRVPHIEAGGHQQEADNLKERFAIGNLKAADERLKRMLQPSLRNQLAFFVTVRGGYIGGRCLLAKNPDTGETYADITAWDPRNMHWGVGADGLEWVCYKIKKTRAQIKAEYGVDVVAKPSDSIEPADKRGSTDPELEGIDTYDFYDKNINRVITSADVLKDSAPHGSPRVPAFMVLLGSMPLLQSDMAENMIAQVGESVYAGLRDVYTKNNDIMSIMLEIVQRARRQTVITESQGGNKTLPEDPFKQGTAIATKTGEKIYTLELQELARETGAYMATVAGEIQRMSIPYSEYGETPFQLSGYAITQLRQASESVLFSRIEAISSAYEQIANLLYDQYMTGQFDAIKLSGVDSHRARFSQRITVEELGETCDYETSLVSQLPQDEAAKWAVAQMAKDGHFMSTEDILDKILGIQDAQQTTDKVKLEMAEQGLPEAVFYDMMMAAANRGEMQIAMIYLQEYQRLMAVKTGQIPPAPADGNNPGNRQQFTPSGQDPRVLPEAATGAAPSPQTSNNGTSFIAPGTPRPGAWNQP